MDEGRSKVLALEEFLLGQEEKIIYIDKELKETLEGVRRAYDYSRKYGDQFFT
jgi:hypothetical protein